MAKEDIVKYQFNKRTAEEQQEIAKMGGIASGKARQEKATMKKTLERLLDEVAKIEGNEENLTYRQLATALQLLGELQEESSNDTPSVNINIVDNSGLEKTLYESNN